MGAKLIFLSLGIAIPLKKIYGIVHARFKGFNKGIAENIHDGGPDLDVRFFEGARDGYLGGQLIARMVFEDFNRAGDESLSREFHRILRGLHQPLQHPGVID